MLKCFFIQLKYALFIEQEIETCIEWLIMLILSIKKEELKSLRSVGSSRLITMKPLIISLKKEKIISKYSLVRDVSFHSEMFFLQKESHFKNETLFVSLYKCIALNLNIYQCSLKTK